MKHPWAICIAEADLESLAPLRLAEGVEVAAGEGRIWLRGRVGEEGLARALRRLPAVGRYDWLEGNQLRRLGTCIPAERFPDLAWQPLAGWLPVEFPAAAFPGTQPAPAALQLRRSELEREAALLLTALEGWTRFAARAAQVRLERLQFAVGPRREVLVRGQPLPPLPGRRYVLHGPLAVPAGLAWDPPVAVEVLQRRWAIAPGDVVLWHEDGTISRVRAEQFVEATRSAVRETAGESSTRKTFYE